MHTRLTFLVVLVSLLFACSLSHPPAKAGPEEVAVYWRPVLGREDPVEPKEGYREIARLSRRIGAPRCPRRSELMPPKARTQQEALLEMLLTEAAGLGADAVINAMVFCSRAGSGPGREARWLYASGVAVYWPDEG